MTHASEILKLIETVSPDDTAKLDEIDARVWCYLREVAYLGAIVFESHIEAFPDSFSLVYICDSSDRFGQKHYVQNHYNHVFYPSKKIYIPTDEHSSIFSPQYTRSRDALKAIRPPWSHFTVSKIGSHGFISYLCNRTGEDTEDYVGGEDYCPTEELAELHAIIQAIEWEKQND